MVNKRESLPNQDLVRLYLNDLGRYPLLTKEDEVRLAQSVEAGREARAELAAGVAMTPERTRQLKRLTRQAEQATESFVTANLRLVVSIAKRYQATEVPLLDLIQEGNLGLMHAVEKFDWRRGFKFSTYATWWIRQSISRGIANSGRTVRLPVHAGDLLSRVVAARGRLESQLGRRPTTTELAADLELDRERVDEILRHVGQPVSLSEQIRPDGGAELGDMLADNAAISPFDAAAAALLSGEVAKLLFCLDEREREILRLRFGIGQDEPQTLDAIGDQFHLTRERIRQIEARAISKLRHPALESNSRDLLSG